MFFGKAFNAIFLVSFSRGRTKFFPALQRKTFEFYCFCKPYYFVMFKLASLNYPVFKKKMHRIRVALDFRISCLSLILVKNAVVSRE